MATYHFGYGSRDTKPEELPDYEMEKTGFSNENLRGLPSLRQVLDLFSPNVERFLIQSNFFKLEQHFLELREIFLTKALLTGITPEDFDQKYPDRAKFRKQHCMTEGYPALNSLMPVDYEAQLQRGRTEGRIKNFISIGFDIGGSNNRVTASVIDENGERRDVVLFLMDHKEVAAELAKQDKLPTLENWTAFLREKANKSLKNQGLDARDVNACKIIWSNQAKAEVYDNDGVAGITCKVDLSDALSTHQKGEPFIQYLTDGQDIGKVFVEDLKTNGFSNCATVLVSNDTIGTCGLILSTGGNGTLEIEVNGVKFYFNGELGGHSGIPVEYLAPSDYRTDVVNGKVIKRDESVIPIEFLICGSGVGRLGENMLHALAASLEPYNEYNGVARYLTNCHKRDEEFTLSPRELSKLLKAELNDLKPNDFYMFAGYPLFRFQAQTIKELVENLMDRGAETGAIMVITSKAHEREEIIKSGKDKIMEVKMDSSMARHFPGFLPKLELALKKIDPEHSYEIKLQDPGVLESVPLQNLADMAAYLHFYKNEWKNSLRTCGLLT